MTLIEAKTITGTPSTVTFSSIPQTYTDLKFVYSVKSTFSGNAVDSMQIRPNGSASNLNERRLLTEINGTSGSLVSNNVADFYIRIQGDSETSTFGSGDLYISNYSSSTLNKAMLSYSTNATGGARTLMSITSGLWSNTSPLTSLTFILESSGTGFANNSTFYLYGISSNAITGTKATGGVIYDDSTYFYHVFGSSGTFTPTQSITADILVIAGGGGGGSNSGAGGGAGGLLGFSSQSLTASPYTVTVGAGGASNTSAGAGANGSNSQFGGLTAAVGGGYGGGGGVVNSAGGNGGSGGGGGGRSGGSPAGGTGTSGQGFAGGTGVNTNSTNPYGGGGGAGGAGGNGFNSSNGYGGVGSSAYSSWGLATGTGHNVDGVVYYAGGGGSETAEYQGQSPYASTLNGGYGGGGGSYRGGMANTGGGAGGNAAAIAGTSPRNGGSGLVIVRYAK